MNRPSFSWIALGLGTLIAMILLRFGPTGAEGGQGLPLLTALFLAEFGFLVALAGAFLGFRAWQSQNRGVVLLLPPIACAALAVGFAWVGVAIWNGVVAS